MLKAVPVLLVLVCLWSLWTPTAAEPTRYHLSSVATLPVAPAELQQPANINVNGLLEAYTAVIGRPKVITFESSVSPGLGDADGLLPVETSDPPAPPLLDVPDWRGRTAGVYLFTDSQRCPPCIALKPQYEPVLWSLVQSGWLVRYGGNRTHPVHVRVHDNCLDETSYGAKLLDSINLNRGVPLLICIVDEWPVRYWTGNGTLDVTVFDALANGKEHPHVAEISYPEE